MYPYNLGFEDIDNLDLNQVKIFSAANTNAIDSKNQETVPVSAMEFDVKFKVPPDIGRLPAELKNPPANVDNVAARINQCETENDLKFYNTDLSNTDINNETKNFIGFHNTENKAAPAAMPSNDVPISVQRSVYNKFGKDDSIDDNFARDTFGKDIFDKDNYWKDYSGKNNSKKDNFGKGHSNGAHPGGNAYKPVFPGTSNPFGPGGSFPNPNLDRPEFVEPEAEGPLFAGGYSKPSGPPPTRVPQRNSAALLKIDGGSIRGCLFHNTYVWLRNGFDFWFYPVYIGKTSVSGFRWMKYGWAYTGVDLSWIDFFQCV